MDLRQIALSIVLLGTSTLSNLGHFVVYNSSIIPLDAAIDNVTHDTCLELDKQTVLNKISSVAHDFGVSQELMTFIVEHESQFNSCAIGDTDLPKPSYGLVQISALYNPQIAPQEAFDPQFALEYLAENIRSGNCHYWTTCKIYFNNLQK